MAHADNFDQILHSTEKTKRRKMEIFALEVLLCDLVQMKIPNLQYGNFRKNLKKCYQV
jgi:hypothetical protein